MNNHDYNLGASLWARLTEDAELPPSVRHGMFGLDQLRDRVLQDLKTLLNTPAPRELFEAKEQLAGIVQPQPVANSTLAYGFPGCVGMASSIYQAEQIAQWIEQSIIRFEPRIKNLSVQRMDTQSQSGQLAFLICGCVANQADALNFKVATHFDNQVNRFYFSE